MDAHALVGLRHHESVELAARDAEGVIGKGHHECFVIDEARFMARLEAKVRG